MLARACPSITVFGKGRNMKIYRAFTVLALAAAFAAACDEDDDISGVQNGCTTLSGTFIATNLTAIGTSNTSLNRNLLTNGGTFSLTFNNGTFTSNFMPQTGGTLTTRTGAFANFGTNFISLGSQILFAGAATGAQTFSCSVSGNTLTLTNPNTTFDFAGNGNAFPAAISITLTRTG
jgi:hypothetical protein